MQGINPQMLHHTYVISGDRKDILKELVPFIDDKCGVKTKGNPDFFYKDYDTFYVEDTRYISSLGQNKTLGKLQVFVLSLKDITLEAQNAFLKITEDPSPNTVFFFVLLNKEILIPTLQSRAMLIEYRKTKQEPNDLAREFYSANPKKRLEIILPFHPKEKEDIDKEKILLFLSNLEVVFAVSKEKEALRDIYDVKKKLQARGVSVKTLLEHLAMVLPFKK